MRRRDLRGVGLAVVITLVSSASTYAWVKEDATGADVERDGADCWFDAQGVTLAEAARQPDGEKFVGVAPNGRRLTFHVPGTEPLRFLRQLDLFNRCMEEKGYSRQPTANAK